MTRGGRRWSESDITEIGKCLQVFPPASILAEERLRRWWRVQIDGWSSPVLFGSFSLDQRVSVGQNFMLLQTKSNPKLFKNKPNTLSPLCFSHPFPSSSFDPTFQVRFKCTLFTFDSVRSHFSIDSLIILQRKVFDLRLIQWLPRLTTPLRLANRFSGGTMCGIVFTCVNLRNVFLYFSPRQTELSHFLLHLDHHLLLPRNLLPANRSNHVLLGRSIIMW